MSSTTTKNRNRFSLILQLASAHKFTDNSTRSVSSPTASTSRSSLRFGRSSATTPSTTPPRASVRASSDPRSPPPPSSGASPVDSPDADADPLPLPSTTNALDAMEKMKLLKKARKISQVFGEVPVGIPAEEGEIDEAPDSGNVGKASVSKASTRRMKTMSWGTSHPQSPKVPPPNVDLLKAIVAPRPFVPMPSPKPSPSPTPSPSIKGNGSPASRRSRASVESSRSPCRRSSESTRPTPTKRSDRSRSASIKSSRRLGQTASESALVSHVDDGTQSDSTHTSSAPLLQTNSASARRVLTKDKWRRKSLDLSFKELTMSPGKTPITPTDEKSTTQPAPGLRRSKSAWGQKPSQSVKEPGERALERAAIIKDLKEGGPFGSQGPLTDKQRAINVRRARKLVQLFGSEPPPALYQVSTTHVETPTESQNRDSIVTILSVTHSKDLLSTQTAREAKHRSYSSISSISSDPSSYSSHVPPVQANKGRKSESDQPRPSSPRPFMPPQESSAPDSPRTSLAADVEDLAAFRQRRLRAAKLSRFFGVNYNALSQSGLDSQPLAPMPPRPSAIADTPNRPTSPNADVDVRIDEPGRFWTLMDGRDNKSADMNDVIGRLRQMRAAT
ncbi:hypothetical protein DENSPDRAFT_878324 [Dentipellis sp. KUC8613]|nr:hypothetical protein DENSPDRAFT_878324 [Dentipellis sp. KUC8613]